MAKPLSLSLLYSANLRGDIALLPQLFTFLQRLKQAAGPDSLILDLGKSCDGAVWHCRQTAGRSMLIALDGMGYHAANVEEALDAANRKQVAQQMTMALVDRATDRRNRQPPFADASEDDGIRLTVMPSAMPARLQICLAPAERTVLDGNVLYLQNVCAGQVGTVSVDLRGSPRISHSAIQDLPPDTPPNPSIAGAIEFIESEARLYHRKRSRSSP